MDLGPKDTLLGKIGTLVTRKKIKKFELDG